MWVSVLAAASIAVGSLMYQVGPLQVTLTGGGAIEDAEGTVGLWANCPQARLGVRNAGSDFYHGKLRWHNVPAGSYLVSGKGVAEAATAVGGTLVMPLSLAGGGSRTMQLEANFKKDFRFAVATSPHKGLRLLSKPGYSHPAFAVDLGYAGILAAQSAASQLSFPTYLLPGPGDTAPLIRRRLGAPYMAFSVGSDRIVTLDDRDRRLGSEQLDWLGHRLQDFRLDGARRVFVFMQRPPFDPRRHHRDGLSKRSEARRLARMLHSARVAAVFSCSPAGSISKNWHGIRQYLLTKSDVMVVEAKGGDLSIRLAVH